jgi:hypothetical protein
MQIAGKVFYEHFKDDDHLDYAIDLVLEIRNHFKVEWEQDWKNEVFLGTLFSVGRKYLEEFECYKKAYDTFKDPPDTILLLLAGCCGRPGVLLSEEEADRYLFKAIEKKITYESALMARGIYRAKGDLKQEEYWDRLVHELEVKNIHTGTIIPDVLQ